MHIFDDDVEILKVFPRTCLRGIELETSCDFIIEGRKVDVEVGYDVPLWFDISRGLTFSSEIYVNKGVLYITHFIQ